MHVIARPPKQVHVAWSVGHESSRANKVTGAVDHWQSCAEREGLHATKIGDDKLVDHNIERIRLRVELVKLRSNVLHAADFEKSDVEIEFARRGLCVTHFQHCLVITAIEDDGQST